MASVALTPRETTLMRAVMANTEIVVSDWIKVAEEAEFKTPKYARDTWTIIKKKLAAAGVGEDGDETDVPRKTHRVKATLKRKAVVEGEDFQTPTKKSRGKKKEVKVDSDSEDGARGLLGKKVVARVKREVEVEEEVDDKEEDAEVGDEDAEGEEA